MVLTVVPVVAEVVMVLAAVPTFEVVVEPMTDSVEGVVPAGPGIVDAVEVVVMVTVS